MNDAGIIEGFLDSLWMESGLSENTLKAFNFSVKQLIAQKKMKRPYDPKKYFDFQFINRTMKERPEWFKDLN